MKKFNKASVAAAVPLVLGVVNVFFPLSPEMMTGLTTVLTPLMVYFVPNLDG